MVLDISYDLKSTVKNVTQNIVALELTKLVVAQENDAGHRIFEDRMLEIYNKIAEGL